MKNLIYTAILLSLSISLLAQKTEREYDYVFFENSLLPGDYFYSFVNYSEGSYVENIRGKLPVCDKKFFTPPNSLELKYTNGDGKWEANISFVKIRGNDFFKPSSYLSFWLYPENTSTQLYPLITCSLQRRQRRSGTTDNEKRSKTLPINSYIGKTEKDGWKYVKIPLKDFGDFGGIPNNIIFSNSKNEGNGLILIDQLELLPEVTQSPVPPPGNISAKGYELHVDVMWEQTENQNINYIEIYRSEDNKNFRPIGIQRPYFNRFTDFTGELNKTYYYKISYLDYQYNETTTSKSAKAQTRQFNDEELLDMVQEASFRYYWEGAEPTSGLALENIPGRINMIAAGASGFGIMAIIVGAERGFITREQAIQRFLKITAFLQGCDKYHGAFSHFMDGPTGKTEPFFGDRDNGGDLVETSFLFQGLLAARAYFDRKNKMETLIRETITKLWEAVEWNWYDREKEGKFLTWHWSPDKGWLIDHKLIGWNETMITYILAMASPTHPIPVSMYYKGWASQEERAVKYRKAWGKTDDGSQYTNGNYYYGIKLPVGVANGGPLFFVHYSFMGLDPNKLTDRYTNYFENNRNIALINWRYCSENPNNHKGLNSEFWGLTASDGPWGYRALEPRKEIDNGTVAPTGALASFPYTPEQSMAALINMYRNHGRYLWGEYGFKDAVNLDENWQAKIFMGLNQAPVTVMIENFRTGLIWNLFMKNMEIKDVVEKIKNYHE
jgi:exo beta-1,2-glucooligosaccharide sophorohydrolase (non-reducing end)